MDKHHILPRYKGGGDTIDNIVVVTRTQHVMWHFANWALWNNTEDFIAYRGLAGTISGHGIAQELRKMAGERSVKEKTGIFAIPKEERNKYSSIGGVKGGARMKNYIWATDGETNTRVPKGLPLPEGWVNGVTRKIKAKTKVKEYESVEEWNEAQKEHSSELKNSRMGDLKTIDLTKRGAITRLSELWGVSRSQVKRYLNKLMLPTGIEPV